MKNIIPIFVLLFCLKNITSQDRTINPEYHFFIGAADARAAGMADMG
jgi:hypothetical protein